MNISQINNFISASFIFSHCFHSGKFRKHRLFVCTFPLRKISRKENFVKCDWPTQIFRRKKFWSWKFSTFNNDIFGKFSVRGNFSRMEMAVTGGLDKFYTVVHEICRPTKVLETLRFRTATRLQRLPIQYMNNLDIVLALFTTPNHRFLRLDTTAAFQAATSATSNWV